jgi:hypothetical protein
VSCILTEVLLIPVNSSNDRETPGYAASEYASTILEMLRRYDKPRRPHVITSDQRANRLITHVVYLEGGNVRVDETSMKVGYPDILRPTILTYQSMGIKLIKVPRDNYSGQDGNEALFTPDAVEWAMRQILPA